jgi:hypothetical protein
MTVEEKAEDRKPFTSQATPVALRPAGATVTHTTEKLLRRLDVCATNIDKLRAKLEELVATIDGVPVAEPRTRPMLAYTRRDDRFFPLAEKLIGDIERTLVGAAEAADKLDERL